MKITPDTDMFKITPDSENGLREVHLINLQQGEDYAPVDIDDLRAVLHAVFPELPETLGACTDAHCRVIDHANVVKTYFVNETMAAKLWELHSFVERLDQAVMEFDLSSPLDILNRLAVALESFEARARRVQRLNELSAKYRELEADDAK